MYKLCLECHKKEGECKCKEPLFTTIFEHGPEPIPMLNEEQWKAVIKSMNRKPTQEEIDRFKEIKEKFKHITL